VSAHEEIEGELVLDSSRRVVNSKSLSKACGELSIKCRYKSGRRLEKHYKVNKVLMGENRSSISLVTGNADGRKYAVKSVRKDELDKAKLTVLRRGVEAHLIMDHPHVVHLQEVLETEKELHLVMEHLEGGELYERALKQKCFSEADAADAARQMLLTLAYLHAHHVTHRDLKLDNWMYEAPGSDVLKLIDFGLARWRGQDPSATMTRACGSLHFVAPEMFSNAYTEKVDTWSLGVIVYILLTGAPLFHGKDDAEIKDQIKGAEFSFCNAFYQRSQFAQDFLHRLLTVDPDGRLSAEQALRHPWVVSSHKLEAPPLDALSALRGLSVAPPLYRAAFEVMARRAAAAEDDSGARATFLALAEDGTGTITRSRLTKLLKHQGVVLPEAEVEVVFNSLDMDRDGELAYSDVFAALLHAEELEADEDLVRAAFASFDSSGCSRGRISAAMLRKLLPPGSTSAAVPADGCHTAEAEESDQSCELGSQEELLAEHNAVNDEQGDWMSFEDFFSFLYGRWQEKEDSMSSLPSAAGHRRFAQCGA